MAVGLLRDDLLSLPGVESADLDGDSSAPSGVRVRLAPGVDPVVVGEEVQRVLALHGLRSELEVAPPTTPPAPPTTPPAPPIAGVEIDDVPDAGILPPVAGDASVIPAHALGEALDSLGVTEGIDGVVVEARAGETISRIRAAGSAGAAIDQAVVSAVAELLGTQSVPIIHSVEARDLEGVSVVTVVIEEAGERLVGSAVVDGGRPYGLGRAVWVALSSR